MSSVREMRFNEQYDCWVVEWNDHRYLLHCGEYFELVLGVIKIPCRLELGQEWYLIMEGARLNLREQDTYKIRI